MEEGEEQMEEEEEEEQRSLKKLKYPIQFENCCRWHCWRLKMAETLEVAKEGEEETGKEKKEKEK